MPKDTRKQRGPWRWESEPFTRGIVEQLQQGQELETRAFLRPVFRWMKLGIRKNGQKDDEVIEKAFAYVNWMVQLSKSGDTERGIPCMDQLQPNYALNTIVTSSQRVGSLPEAMRAFHLLIKHGYEPDVFTYTALIDVTVRNGDVLAAIQRYHDMRTSKSRPNIVTYNILIRAVGVSEVVDSSECLVFLASAREDEAFDDVLLLEALAVCALRNDLATAANVLSQIRSCAPNLHDSEQLVHAIAHIVQAREDRDSVLDAWLNEKLITPVERERALTPKTLLVSQATFKAQGCLGRQTTDSVRQAVVDHDIARLIERMLSGAPVSTNDFETLVHQCRKRKWKDEVRKIVDVMRELSETGWTSSENAEIVIQPQEHLRPTIKTYVSIVDAYLCCEDEAMAWEAFLEVDQYPELTRDHQLYRKYIRGCYLLTVCNHIPEMLQHARKDQMAFTIRMCTELARMYGFAPSDGVDVVLNQLPSSPLTAAKEKIRLFLEELVKSCALKRNTSGAKETIKAMLANGFRRSAATEMSMFICCLHHDRIPEATQMLQSFQQEDLMLDIPMYESLLREMFVKYTRRGQTFDESSFAVAMRTLYSRRSLFDQVFKERNELESWTKSSVPQDVSEPTENADSTNSVAFVMKYWCDRETLRCAPLMYAQHFVEIITTIRDRESKLAAEATIREALVRTEDPVLFNLRAAVSLRSMGLTFRGQGKLAKQMLALLPSEFEITQKHLDYCVSQFHCLTMHIVKELDDYAGIHVSHREEMLSFCVGALENDNVDKIVGYVVNKPELYTLETVEILVPKLAELFVLQGESTVLQFFKPEVDDSLTMKRMFIREVIEVESLSEEDQPQGFSSTIKAITELKLEHEQEFMSFLLRAPPTTIEMHPELMDSMAQDNSIDYLQIPVPDDHVVVVDNDESVALAYEILMNENNDAVGIDAEWRPDAGTGFVQSKCSVLQLACQGYAFVFDLMELSMNDLEELFRHVFASRSITKLGFGLDGDIKRLRWSFPDAHCFDDFTNVLDFSIDDKQRQDHSISDYSTIKTATDKHKLRRRQKGLSAYAQEVLGLPLNKQQQRSDWERRPLTSSQISYAALDAYVLLMIHQQLQFQG